MAYIDPFDFEKILVTTFAGTPEIFTILSVIGLSLAGGFFKMSNSIFLILLGLFGIIFSAWTGNAIYVLVILLIGLLTFKSIAKIVT